MCNPDLTHDIEGLANIIRRQPGASRSETSIPLGRVLADDSADLAVGDAEQVNRVELVADEVGAGAQRLAEGAEECLTGTEAEDEASVLGHNELLVGCKDLIDDEGAVGAGDAGALREKSAMYHWELGYGSVGLMDDIRHSGTQKSRRR